MNAVPNKKGISTLIVVIIISAVTVMAAFSAALTGIDETKIGLNQNKSIETFSGADGCAEEALVKLNGNRSYTGETDLTIGNTICDIVVSGSGDTRTINVTAINSMPEGTYTREIEVSVDWSTNFQITSWGEIID